MGIVSHFALLSTHNFCAFLHRHGTASASAMFSQTLLKLQLFLLFKPTLDQGPLHPLLILQNQLPLMNPITFMTHGMKQMNKITLNSQIMKLIKTATV